MIFIKVNNFTNTKLPKDRAMDDTYIHDYLINVLPWHYLLKDRLGMICYVDDIEHDEQRGVQIAGMYFPPNTQKGDHVGQIEIYRQTKTGNISRHRFWHDILHEIGHATYEGFSKRVRFQTAWIRVWAGSQSVFSELKTNNNQSSDEEEFAQTYALYIQDGPNLGETNPMRYSFMRKNVFSGREYEREAI